MEKKKKKKKVNHRYSGKKKNVKKKVNNKKRHIQSNKKYNKKKKKTNSKQHSSKKKQSNEIKKISNTNNDKITKKKKNEELELQLSLDDVEFINSQLSNEKKVKKVSKKKKKPIKWIFLIMFILLIFTISIFSFLYFKSSITLLGDKEINIEVYSKYEDDGYVAKLYNLDLSKYVSDSTNLNSNKLGSYYKIYKLSFPFYKKVKRKINVVDTEKPEIKLIGEESLNIYVGDKYADKGVDVSDNYDKDIKDKIVVDNKLKTDKSGTYEIVYTVTDSSGNSNSITRKIVVKEKIVKRTNSSTCKITNSISKYICENNLNVSVGYYNLNNGKSYYYNKNKVYYGASLIKTLDALYVYDNNLVNDEIKEYVKKAITVSDNPSHHYLVNYIGFNKLKSYGNSLGANYTLVGGDNFGSTNVSDQIVYMKKLYQMTKDNQLDELKTFFLNTRKNYLLFDNSPLIMHKYGHWEYIYHNVGIVLDESPYIVVILTSEGYNDYQTIISTISKLIYEYHKTN